MQLPQIAGTIEKARSSLRACTLCPRKCGVNRLEGEKGVCRTGRLARVSSYSPHFGEEAPLVGTGGSGTIFFTHCNLYCTFCQNSDISHLGRGYEVPGDKLAGFMLDLQDAGCENINFVTPSHVVPQILEAVETAARSGLNIPLVYNSGGYDRVETLKLLEGVIDIYMPDFKFMDPAIAEATCCAPDYPQAAKEAVIEMHRQVGDLVLNERGIAVKGLLVRHLVLPAGLSRTRDVMRFLSREVSPDTYVNIMPQYRPEYRAHEHPGLDRMLTRQEYQKALTEAREEGITRLD